MAIDDWGTAVLRFLESAALKPKFRDRVLKRFGSLEATCHSLGARDRLNNSPAVLRSEIDLLINRFDLSKESLQRCYEMYIMGFEGKQPMIPFMMI